LGVQTQSDATLGKILYLQSLKQTLAVTVGFASDTALPPPVVAVTIHAPDGRTIASSSTQADHLELVRDATGRGTATLEFPKIPLLKGEYYVGAYLLSENGIHVYDAAANVATLHFSQESLEQGVVSLPHQWRSVGGVVSPAERLGQDAH
jgi:lipopolysaccharide transport system ATP-binding protein